MPFDELLANYEQQINALENSLDNKKRTIFEQESQYAKQIKVINQQLSDLLSRVNELETAKYVSYAVRQLQVYFDWFKIDITSSPEGDDDQLSNLYNQIRSLNRERCNLEDQRSNLVTQMKMVTEKVNRAKSELTCHVQAEYQHVSGGTVIDYNIAGKTFPSPSSLPQNIIIGNLLKPATRILSGISGGKELRFPLSMDMNNGGNIILKTAKRMANEEVSRIFVAIAIKMMEAFPYSTLKVGVVNYTSFSCVDALHRAIAKSDASLGNLVVDMRGIDQFIPDVTKRCADINGKLLANGCANLFELYERGIETEPFQLILIKDALKDVNETNLRMLYSWVTTYSKCGIRLVLVDEMSEETFKSKSSTYRELVEQIKASCKVFTFSEKGVFSSQGETVELISLNKNNTDSDVFIYCSQYVEEAKSRKKAYVSYEQIGFGQDNKKSDTSISIPIAYNAPNIWNIEFHCTSKSPLANLIVGVPGTGKSRLIDAMILNGAIKYSPDELIFHLLDFKDGLSSDAYLSDCRIPHVKVVSRENKAEEANIILSSILQEKEERAAKFKQYRVSSIAGYNQYSTQKMPRLIIVIDECQHIFESDNIAKKCEQIVREGRAAGIHLVLATQAVTQQMMRTIKFVDGRYCFELANQSDAEQLLNKECAKRLSEVNKSSHKAFVTDFSKGDCEIIKIEPAFDGDFDESRTRRSEYARRIREKWSNYPVEVFEVGNQEPYIASAYDFMRLRHSETLSFYIGINYQNRADINFCLDSEGQSAVFICSSISTIGESLLSSIILQGYRQEINMRVVNATGPKKVGDILSRLAKAQNIVIGCESDYTRILEDVYSEYLVRSKTPNKQYEPILFVVNGLQNILEFKNNVKVKTSPAFIAENPGEEARMSFSERREARRQATMSSENVGINGKDTFFELLGNSYRVGIYICCSIDSVNVTNSSGQLFSSGDRNIIKQCRYKILDGNAGEEIRNIMENSFKEKMLMRMNENICFISERQRNYYKTKYLQFASSSEAIQQVLSKEENA